MAIKKIFEEKYGFYIILIFIILFHCICNYIWLSQNRMSPIWDEANFLLMALKYKDFFSHISAFNLSSFAQISGYYPPLFPISSLILCTIFGNSIKTMAMTNIIYMLIMLFSIFKIGEAIFDRKTGLLAAFIFSMFPIVFGTSRVFLLDYALTAIVTLSIYLLLKTNYFINRKYAILFDLSLTIGILTKNTFGFFIIGPLIYCFLKGILSNSQQIKISKIINFSLALGIASIILIPWYILSFDASHWKLIPLTHIFLSRLGLHKATLLNLLDLKISSLTPQILYFCLQRDYPLFIMLSFLFLLYVNKIYRIKLFAAENKKKWFLVFSILLMVWFFIIGSLSNIAWYTIILKDQIGPLFFLILLIFLRKFYTQEIRDKYIIILWVIAPLFLISVFVHKSSRYTMPYLPAIAIILAAGIFSIKKTLHTSLLLFFVCMFCLIQFFFLSFILYYDSSNIYFKNRFNREIIAPDPANYWIMHPPIKGEWKMGEILKWINNHSNKPKKSIGLLISVAAVNSGAIRYYAYLNRLSFEFVDYMENEDYSEYFKLDYLVTLENLQLEHWPWAIDRMIKLNEELKRNSDKYVIINEFELPHYWDIGRNNKLVIYAKKKNY